MRSNIKHILRPFILSRLRQGFVAPWFFDKSGLLLSSCLQRIEESKDRLRLCFDRLSTNGVGIIFLLIFYCNAFALSQPKLFKEKPIVVLITSYNNSEWCDWNLSSVFAQTYTNYRIIYIDDCSTDDTYQLVLEKIKQSQLEQNESTHHIQLIRNTENKGVLANVYAATHTCSDEEIIVILDGDDAFAHPEVLARINKAYQNNNVWMTYGQYKESGTQKIGICAPIPITFIQRNAYREYPWVTSHVRTYYAWLFKQIQKESLMHNGDFFYVATDLAAMFPMLEMAGGRFEFINEVLYVYNTTNRLNNFKLRRKKQLECERVIRQLPRYKPLLPIVRSP
jgi:glycosyltransferase involved in cell wall biosynthesis